MYICINIKIMGRKRKLTTNEIIESINNTAPKIIFYTDKISVRLKNINSIDFGNKNSQMVRLGIVRY